MALSNIQSDPLVNKIIQYAITGNGSGVSESQAQQLVQRALQTALDKVFHGLSPDQVITCLLEQHAIHNASAHLIPAQTMPNSNQVAIQVAEEMFESGEWQPYMEMFMANLHNSYPITHLSMLWPNDYILLYGNTLASFVCLTLVDPFLSEFTLHEHMMDRFRFRHRINGARQIDEYR